MLEDGIRRWNPWWADSESLKMLSGVEREISSEIFKTTKLPHIKDLIGVRRSGKTTTMYQIIDRLISGGASPKDIVFLNFDDSEINETPFEEILKSLGKINPEMKYLYIDEVQQKKGWERWMRTLYDTKAFKQIFVSGSSASILSQDIGRVLTGRHITFSIFPFSFKEHLRFLGWKRFDEDFLKFNKNKLLNYQNDFIKTGGFPETIGKSDNERKIILTNIHNDILSRDISSRFGVPFESIKKLSYHMLTNTGKEFSYRSVANSVGFSTVTAEKYIEFLKESFIVLALDFFSYKTKVQFKQNKKMYCIDTGLRNAVSFRFSGDYGRLAENVVFIELKRMGKDVYYWKDKFGREVDFLVKEGLRVKEIIQVCWNLDEQETENREIKGLLEAAREFKLKAGIIITEDKEGEKNVGKIKIKYIPLWKWLLKI